jgi:CBS domain containing-hemolysin-like protein
MTSLYIGIAITFIGILMSALYSGLETGLYTINKIRLDVRASTGMTSALRLQKLINHPTRMLAVLLVFNNLANFLASYGAARIFNATSLDPWQVVFANAIILIPILFIFGEVLPKDLFRTHTDTWTYRWSAPLSWSDKVLWWSGIVPLISGIGQLAQHFFGAESSYEPSPRRRFGLLFKEGLDGGVLSDEQITLADRVLAMKSLTVRSEMVPWTRVSCIGTTVSHARRAAAIEKITFTRLPVVDEQGIVQGVLPVLNALLDPDAPTSKLLITPLFLSPETPVRDALQQLRKSGVAMAIVIGPSQKPVGIVTLKDLVEPIVGELGAW